MPQSTLERTVVLPMPHRGQQLVRTQARRFNWLSAGRRWRKTTLVMAIAVEGALAGQRIIWGAPTFDQVRIGWAEARRACGGVAHFNQSQMIAEFPSGGAILYRSLDDPDNARGHTADGIVIDECADVAEIAWHEVLRPMLLDTGGWLWAIGTPKGHNWFWREHTAAAERPAAMAWQAPLLGARVVDGQLIREPHPLENPAIRFDELTQMFATTPERVFRQEILAEFLENAGGVFRNVRGCVAGALRERPGHVTEPYAIGVDLAKHSDYTVCVVMDLHARQVVAFERWNQADWPLQKARIITLAQRWNNALVWLDATGIGDPIYDDLRQSGLRIHPYRLTLTSKQALLNNAVLLVEQQQVHYPEIPVLLAELAAYEYQRTPSGSLRMAAPEGLHDDCVIAFALACWPLAHGAQGLPAAAIEQLLQPQSEIGGVRILRRTF